MTHEEILTSISRSVSNVTGVTLENMRSRSRLKSGCLARGAFYCIARGMGIHPEEIGGFLHRSRCNVITLSKRYHTYYTLGDREIKKLIKDIIKDYENGQ